MKIVVQCSGGIESTTLLGKAIKEVGVENVYPIAFDTDSIFWRHRDSIAVKRVTTNLQLQQNLFICRMPQCDFLEYRRDDLYADVGFIPGFKFMFNIASMAFAQRVGASLVYIGNMADNVFPDEDPKFLLDSQDLYNRTYPESPVFLSTPFHGYTKAQVIQEGMGLGIDLFDTVSCGREEVAGGLNCGRCPWCSRRRAGFSDSGVEDKTVYTLDPSTYHFAD